MVNSSKPILTIVFCVLKFTMFFVISSPIVYAYKNNNGNALFVQKIKHKFNGTLSAATKLLKMRGASDFVVIRRLPDGVLDCSPLFVHFGSGIFAEKGQKAPAVEGVRRVAMAVNGKTIEGMGLKTDQNGIVEQRKVNLTPLMHLLRRNGRYSVRFSVENGKGRTVGVDCFLYFWDSNAKLVVSDIDGTVTKSDIWGMILGKAWVQRGIRTLYKKIKQRGYKIVYLSARPALAGTLTRNFLRRLKMPSGALLLSPEPLEKALKTAVKDPQRIKIICMQRLNTLYNFPRSGRRNFGRRRDEMKRKVRNPFFAAFGNQPSDRLAYQMLAVGTMFMVNPKGAVTVYRKGGQSVDSERTSYRHINDQLDSFFPHLMRSSDHSLN